MNYPPIGDTDLQVAKLCDMLHPNASGAAKERTAADDAAREKFPDGWDAPKPYIRIVPQPQG